MSGSRAGNLEFSTSARNVPMRNVRGSIVIVGFARNNEAGGQRWLRAAPRMRELGLPWRREHVRETLHFASTLHAV